MSSFFPDKENPGYVFKAWAILPDHLHWLITPGESNFSNVVSSFNRGFGYQLKALRIIKSGEKIWHPRFWEHTVKDQQDYNRCVDYINFNPVKHGLVKNASEWEHSSYREYVKRGIYEEKYVLGTIPTVSGAEFD